MSADNTLGIMKKIILLAAFVSFSALSLGAKADTRPSTELTSAFNVAVEHFKALIQRPYQNDDPEMARHMAQLSSYHFTVWREQSNVIVEVGPLPLKDGSTLRGGGARYVVDSASGKILQFQLKK